MIYIPIAVKNDSIQIVARCPHLSLRYPFRSQFFPPVGAQISNACIAAGFLDCRLSVATAKMRGISRPTKTL